MFSPRQQLAHGLCVQAFRELVDEDKANGGLDDVRKAAWCYVALALDKLINTNSQLCRWHSNRQVVAGTFDSHDFGMKWSYTEMAVGIEGLGLEWALRDIGDCIDELVKMSGYPLAATQQNTNGRNGPGRQRRCAHCAAHTGHHRPRAVHHGIGRRTP